MVFCLLPRSNLKISNIAQHRPNERYLGQKTNTSMEQDFFKRVGAYTHFFQKVPNNRARRPRTFLLIEWLEQCFVCLYISLWSKDASLISWLDQRGYRLPNHRPRTIMACAAAGI